MDYLPSFFFFSGEATSFGYLNGARPPPTDFGDSESGVRMGGLDGGDRFPLCTLN